MEDISMLVAKLINRLGRAAVPAEMDEKRLPDECRVDERELYQRVSRGSNEVSGWQSTPDIRYRQIAALHGAVWAGPLGEKWDDTWSADVLVTPPGLGRVVIEFKVIRNGNPNPLKTTIEHDVGKIKELRGVHVRNNVSPLDGYLAMLICDGVNLSAKDSISRISEWVGSSPLVTGDNTSARKGGWEWAFPVWKVSPG
jgi:hypothetical protein